MTIVCGIALISIGLFLGYEVFVAGRFNEPNWRSILSGACCLAFGFASIACGTGLVLNALSARWGAVADFPTESCYEDVSR